MAASQIPTVPRWKILMNIGSFMRNPIPMINESLDEYGDSYITYLGARTRMIITRDPGLIQYVMQKNHSNYKKSEMQTEIMANYIGKGLLTTNGSYWLRQRRMIQPGFHKKKLNSLVDIMNKSIIDYCNELEERLGDNPILDMSVEMTKLTLLVVAQSLFSTGIDRNGIEFLGASITRLQHAIIKDIRMPMFNWWRAINGFNKESENIARQTQKMLQRIIVSRKSGDIRPDDLLDMLLDVRYEDTGEAMTDQQVLEESLVLFVAGHETSANAMAWLHYLLHENADERIKIRTEIDELDNHIPTMEDAMNMSSISQAVSETMRIYPPAWITDRVALEDDQYGGITIKKGDIVSPFIYGAHNDSQRWESPDKFIPSRFSKENKTKIQSFSYLPFGGGPRLCIGQQFALIEMQLIVYHLYKRFDFELIPDQDIDMQPLVTLRPRNGIYMKVKKR